jgi:hypothetical protein
MERGTQPVSEREAVPEHRAITNTERAEAATSKLSASPCDACAGDVYVEWRDRQLTPAFNFGFHFAPPQGRRLVVEFVTASVEVPAGESARLRMFTGLSGQPGNFDLTLTYQGVSSGVAKYVATHPIRTYTDGFLAFNVNRDNATTAGHAVISASGYLV